MTRVIFCEVEGGLRGGIRAHYPFACGVGPRNSPRSNAYCDYSGFASTINICRIPGFVFKLRLRQDASMHARAHAAGDHHAMRVRCGFVLIELRDKAAF